MNDPQSDLEAQLTRLIAAGYHSPTEALDALDDAINDAGLDGPAQSALRTHLARRAKALDQQQAQRERTWTERTTNDHIDRAFRELNTAGIIALQNAGYTTSDGWSDAVEAAHARGGCRGAVFFHGQDVDRAIDGGGLMLAFGGLFGGEEPLDEREAATTRIGEEACKILRLNGLTVEWNGSPHTRLRIPPFSWQKRRHTRAAGHDVQLSACDLEHRIKVIKACTSLGIDMATARAGLSGLKPRTHRWDTSPPWIVARGLTHEAATRMAQVLTDAGAVVDVLANEE
jgi:hypothetical protein